MTPVPWVCFRKVFQVEQVVSGDQDSRSFDRAGVDGDRGGKAEMVGVGLVQQLHDLEVHHAGLQDGVPHVLVREIDVGEGLEQRLVHERVDLLVLVSQDPAVIGIGGYALQPVDQQLLQALHVLVLPANPLTVQATPLAVCWHWLQYIDIRFTLNDSMQAILYNMHPL